MDSASTIEKWRRRARILALAALLASFCLPTLRVHLRTQDDFFPGWAVFLLAFASPFIPAALTTIALLVYLIRGLRGAASRGEKPVTLVGSLLAVAWGVRVATGSDGGLDHLGIGYWYWLGSFVVASWACLLRDKGQRPPRRTGQDGTTPDALPPPR